MRQRTGELASTTCTLHTRDRTTTRSKLTRREMAGEASDSSELNSLAHR